MRLFSFAFAIAKSKHHRRSKKIDNVKCQDCDISLCDSVSQLQVEIDILNEKYEKVGLRTRVE